MIAMISDLTEIVRFYNSRDHSFDKYKNLRFWKFGCKKNNKK
jgi:hypothetical protein